MSINVELIFGLVAPIGGDLDAATNALSDFLRSVGYEARTVRLSDAFEIGKKVRKKSDFHRIKALMKYGDDLRKQTRNKGIVAYIAAAEIARIRRDLESKKEDGERGCAVIVRQFKTPEEIRDLRKIYGSRLCVLSCYSSRPNRVTRLAERLAHSSHELQTSSFRDKAEKLIIRDEQDRTNSWGQNVRKAFPQGDVFIDVDDHANMHASLTRALEIAFGHPHHTPTRDEFGMYQAEAAALRSSALGRQVGAVITTSGGDIISVGCNEVPCASGGLYWEGDSPDRRDHTLGYDTNDRFKEKLLGEIIRRLNDAQWIRKKKREQPMDELIRELLYREDGAILAGAQVDSILEFGRCVHAEMAAIVDAARRGTSVNEGVLYTTTFPCHECARHIVAAGIRRVVYRIPYPKSLVRELYPDSIDIDRKTDDTGKVSFEPFCGIAPRRYTQFFTMRNRKDVTGKVAGWERNTAELDLGDYFPPNDLVQKDEAALITQLIAATGDTDG